jgi:hypothetical protein
LDVQVKTSSQSTWSDLDWNETGMTGLQERRRFESVSGDTMSNDIQINNGSFYICEGGNCPGSTFLTQSYDSGSDEGDLYVEHSAEFGNGIFVLDNFRIANSANASQDINYNIIGTADMGSQEDRAIPYVVDNDDLYISGYLAVGESLFADAIIGQQTIDEDSHTAFIVRPFGQPDMWVLNVDTYDREVNVRDYLTVNDTISVGGETIYAYSKFGNLDPSSYSQRIKDHISEFGNDAVIVTGNLGVVGDIYGNAIIGQQTIDENSTKAFRVQPYGHPELWVLNVETDPYHEVNITGNLTVSGTIQAGLMNGSRYPYNRIGSGEITSQRIQDHLDTDFTSSEDMIVTGNLGVVGDIYGNAIIGQQTIDENSTKAFRIQPYAHPELWVLNVETDPYHEVNVTGNLTVTDTIQVGTSDGLRVSYNRIGDGTPSRAPSMITNNDDVYINGDLEVNGYLYSDVVIGTYSVQSNNDPAFEVNNASAYQIFSVNTIDGSVNVTGNTADMSDSDTHNELNVKDDAYISDDLIVGDVFNVGNGKTGSRVDYNTIGSGTSVDIADDSSDLYIGDEVVNIGIVYKPFYQCGYGDGDIVCAFSSITFKMFPVQDHLAFFQTQLM